MATRVPVEFFLQNFKPNAIELRDLLAVYDHLERKRDSTTLLQELCVAIPRDLKIIEDEDEQLKYMMFAYQSARRLEDLEIAVQLLSRTITDFQFVFEPRYHLGMTLVELERPAEAIEHLEWCHDQDPGHMYVPDLIRRARRQMLELAD